MVKVKVHVSQGSIDKHQCFFYGQGVKTHPAT